MANSRRIPRNTAGSKKKKKTGILYFALIAGALLFLSSFFNGCDKNKDEASKPEEASPVLQTGEKKSEAIIPRVELHLDRLFCSMPGVKYYMDKVPLQKPREANVTTYAGNIYAFEVTGDSCYFETELGYEPIAFGPGEQGYDKFPPDVHDWFMYAKKPGVSFSAYIKQINPN